MLEVTLITIELEKDNKIKANDIYEEAIKWLDNNYKIEKRLIKQWK